MKLTFALTGIALAAASFASTGSDDTPCSKTCSATPRAALASNAADDIVTTAVKAGSFKTLAAALKSAELIGALQGEGPFTVFAPTDAAFAKLPKGTVESLLEEKNRGALTGILTYHVVAGDVRSKQIVKDKLTTATTLNGQRLDIAIDEGSVTIDGATVVTADIVCSNGVIHVIDTVILPEG